jgi:hypothetical protein
MLVVRDWSVALVLLGLGFSACRPAVSVRPASEPGGAPAASPPLSASVAALQGPIGLVGEDGNWVRLRALVARAKVIAPIAVTELELRFDALPAKSRGELVFLLPERAALHRFAIEADGAFHEAEIVREPDAAPVRVLSPGPAEKADPRLHRIELANTGAPAHVRLSYVEPLGLAGYRLPLSGLAALESLAVSAEVTQKTPKKFGIERKNEAPEDFVLGPKELGPPPRVAALRAGNYGVARVAPKAIPSPEITFLVDTSRSQPVPLGRLSEELQRLSDELARASAPPLVSVVGFDQDIHPIVLRARPPLGAAALAPLAALGRLGGTDLTHALSAVIALDLPHRHLAVFSDFSNSIVATGNAFNIRRSQLTRLDAVGMDAASVRRVQALEGGFSSSGSKGVIVDFGAGGSALAGKLLEPTPQRLRVGVSGAAWASTQQGDEHGEIPEVGRGAWVFAEYTDETPLALSIDGKAEAKLPVSRDPALATVLGSLIGQSRFADVDRYPRMQAYESARKFAAEHQVLPRSLSLQVVGGAPNAPKLLARRIFDSPLPATQYSSIDRGESRSRKPDERCPDLIGLGNASRVGDGCPPLYVSFAEAKQRLFAEVKFAGAGVVAAQSPHLGELAELLTYRTELEELGVRTATRSQAQAVIRHLEGQGVARGRLVIDRPLDASLPPRKATPQCKTPGERVVLEVRRMGIGELERRIQKRAPEVASKAAPTRFGEIAALLRQAAYRTGPLDAAERALRASRHWIEEERDNPVAYVALGDALAGSDDRLGAVRAYGSLFDFDVPGAGLRMAAAARLELNVGATPEGRRHGGTAAREERVRAIAVESFRTEWQEHREQPAGGRGYAYAAYRAGDPSTAYGYLHEAAKLSAVARQIELPVFAHLYLTKERQASPMLELIMAPACQFPMQAAVHGAVLSWDDTEAELEVSARSEPGRFTYDSVFADQGGLSRAKFLPLPMDDDAYPIEVSVRAVRLGPRGYAFGMLRVLNYNGRGRLSLDEKPVVLTRVGESVMAHGERILQVPQ